MSTGRTARPADDHDRLRPEPVRQAGAGRAATGAARGTAAVRGLAADGSLAIGANAHIRLAAHENNGGLRLLRRGYSYTDGVDPETLLLDSGLFFLAFVRSPDQFVRPQQQFGAADALNECIQHVGSALFAWPRRLGSGENWGSQLFD